MAWGPIIHDKACRPHWEVSPKASGLTFAKLSSACRSGLLTAVGVLLPGPYCRLRLHHTQETQQIITKPRLP